MTAPADSAIHQRLDAYVAWVRSLRQGTVPSALVTDDQDPLAQLGRELELLSATVARREDELRNLFQLVTTVERGVLLDEVLNRIFDGFKPVIPFDRIGCAFVSDDGSRVVAYWARTELGPVHIASGFTQPLAGSSLEAVIASGRPRIINDLPAYLAAKPHSEATRRIVEEGGRSSLTCPLLVEGRPLGFLFFTSRERNTYRDIHQSVFLQIASQVSAILEKSRMYERLVEHNHTLLDRTQRLEVIASHDPLTGTLNRRALEGLLDERFMGHPGALGVIMADIDRFKVVNDTYGHAAGDQTLREFAQRLSGTLRTSDVIGRYGGEEFLIVVPATGSDDLAALAERLRQSVAARPFEWNDQGIQVTASFGIAVASPGETPAGLIARADHALYRAKHKGRNRCERG